MPDHRAQANALPSRASGDTAGPLAASPVTLRGMNREVRRRGPLGRRWIAMALAVLMTVQPVLALAQECDSGVAQTLDSAARGGLEYEVRRDETSMRPAASVFDLGCLNTLMSLNLNIFSGGLPSLAQLLAMGTRMLCNYAQQEFARLTAPLQGTFSIPGLPGGLGSALGLSTIRLGSLGIGNGTGGLTINGSQDYSAAFALGTGWLTGNPAIGTGYGQAENIAFGGISGTTIMANAVNFFQQQAAASQAASAAIKDIRPPAGSSGGVLAGLPVPAGYRQVVGEDFSSGLGIFSRAWGQGVDTSVPGQITMRRTADESDSGAMVPPTGATAGFGYGLYTFDMSFEGNSPGPYALIWPSTDKWPGPEMDLVELAEGGAPYSTLHWKGENGTADGTNESLSQTLGGINVNQRHVYQFLWEAGRLTSYVDGVPYATFTDHVGADAAHGGENAAPGVGMQTSWNVNQQSGQPNSITLYGFSYSAP